LPDRLEVLPGGGGTGEGDWDGVVDFCFDGVAGFCFSSRFRLIEVEAMLG
jgi:hypothetical protein